MENCRKNDASGSQGIIIDALYPALIRILIGALIIVLCLWLLAGGIEMALGLAAAFTGNWAAAAEHTSINALGLLALLEVIRTLQAYLKLGRMRVTFILDTALAVLRIVTARFSPELRATDQIAAN